MLEVFTTNQMQLYCFMRSLNYFVFLKSYVLGNVCKLCFANIKGSTIHYYLRRLNSPKGGESQCSSLNVNPDLLCHTEVSGFQ